MHTLVIDHLPATGVPLMKALEKNPSHVRCITCAGSVTQAIEYLSLSPADAVFCHLALPGLERPGLLEQLTQLLAKCPVFATGTNPLALAQCPLQVQAFLPLPASSEHLKALLHRLACPPEPTKAPWQGEILPVFDGTDYLMLPVTDLIHIEAQGSYSRLVVRNREEITASRNLSFFAKMLASQGFLRCHRSHLINPRAIARYTKTQGGYFTLINGETVPVSQHMKEQLATYLRHS